LLLGLTLGIGLPLVAGVVVLAVLLVNRNAEEKAPEKAQENPPPKPPLVRVEKPENPPVVQQNPPIVQPKDNGKANPEPPALLPEENFPVTSRDLPKSFVLTVTNNQGMEFRTTSLFLQWSQTTPQRNARMRLNWSPWRAGQARRILFSKSTNPSAIRLNGLVTAQDGKVYRVDCRIPTPVAPPKNTPEGEKTLPTTLRRSGFLVRYDQTPTHLVLSVTNNHGADFVNSSLTLRWYQRAHRSNASQLLNWAAWKAGETQQFQLARRDNPRSLRLVGRVTTKDGKNHRVSFLLPQPRLANPLEQ
jgi:hypothetical protein